MDEFEMYVYLKLIVRLKDGEEITYLRDERPEYAGYFSIQEYELEDIKTIADLIGILEKGELLHLSDGDSLDIDEFCEFLIEKNGKEFVPDEEEEWYRFDSQEVDSYGMSGEKLVEFWDAYQENKKNKQAFIMKLKEIEQGKADQLILTKTYDSLGMGMDDDYEDEIYTVKLS